MVTCTDAPFASSFIIKNDFPFGSNPVGIIMSWRITPLRNTLLGNTKALNSSRQINWLGCPPDQNIILQLLLGL